MDGAGPITVLIADDNGVVRAVVREMLHGRDGVEVVGEAADGADALAQAGLLRPDVVLLDHRMPVRDGLSVVAGLTRFSRVLMLTRTVDDDVVLDAVRAGALGYLVHGQFAPAELGQAIRAVAAGEAHLSPTAARILVTSVRRGPAAPDRFGLSPREREVMDLIAQDLSNTSIAARLVLSAKTVENHVNHVFAKLGATSRAQAIAVWRRQRR